MLPFVVLVLFIAVVLSLAKDTYRPMLREMQTRQRWQPLDPDTDEDDMGHQEPLDERLLTRQQKVDPAVGVTGVGRTDVLSGMRLRPSLSSCPFAGGLTQVSPRTLEHLFASWNIALQFRDAHVA